MGIFRFGKPFAENVNPNELNNAILIHKLESPETSRNSKAGKENWCCAWSPDGLYFAWSKGHRNVAVIPLDEKLKCPLYSRRRQNYSVIDADDLVWSLAFGCKNKGLDLLLAIGLQNGRIRIWDVYADQQKLTLIDHTKVVRSLIFAPDGSLRLLSASRDTQLKLWQVDDNGNMFKSIKTRGTNWLYSCCWSPNSLVICVTGSDRYVQLIDGVTYSTKMKLEGHNHDVVACSFSPDSQIIATSSFDSTVIVWHVQTGSKLRHFSHLHPNPSLIFAASENGAFVRGVSFSCDGVHIASVADDGYLRFWNIEFDTNTPQAIAEVSNALCCSFSPDGKSLAVGNRSGAVSFFDAPTQIATLQHMARSTILKHMNIACLVKLPLPTKMINYLKFVINRDN